MFGVVPKTVWQGVVTPDAQNRIPIAIRCMLARDGQRNVLIDCGQGDKLSPLERSAYALEYPERLTESLLALGVTPDEIDMVVMTHLHWDHAGGCTRWGDDGRPVPSFPNATYFINRLEWEDATCRGPEMGGAYAADNVLPIEAAGQLVLVDDTVELMPGLWVRATGGHTRGHQAVLIESGGEGVLFPSDFVPTTAHIRRMWCTAYDILPMDTRRTKPELLGEAADRGWWIVWEHDPEIVACRLERHPKREFVVTEPRKLRSS